MLKPTSVNISTENILSDNGHVILKCSSCSKDLVDLFVVKKDDSLKWKTVAHCCYCGDRSYITEVNGMFRPCGIMQLSDSDPDHSEMITELSNIKTENEVIVFYTAKGKK
jgi:hypothetical protein